MDSQQREYEEIIQSLALEMAPRFNLKDGEFALRIMGAKKLGGQGWMVKWGSIYRLYWSIPLDDVTKFGEGMERALKAIAWMKRQKRTDMVMWDGLRHPPADVPNAYRQLYDLPPLLDREEVEYELSYKVKMIHKVTGVVIEVEGPENKGIRKLVEKARAGLTEMVIDVVKQLTAQEPPTFVGPAIDAKVDSYLATDGERHV